MSKLKSIFDTGYDKIEEEAKQAKKRKEAYENGEYSKGIQRFFIKADGDDNERVVRFLTEDPVVFKEHTIKNPTGKPPYSNHLCIGAENGCVYCAEETKNPATKGAYLIYDKTPFSYENSEGKTISGDGQLRLYVTGATNVSVIKSKASKYGLTDRDYEITRTGEGTSTTYSYDRQDEDPLDEDEIIEMLGANADAYDGTEESLQEIVRTAILIENDMYDADEDGEEVSSGDEDEEKKDKKSIKKSSKVTKKPLKVKTDKVEKKKPKLFKSKK